VRHYLRDPTFSRFDTILECDVHTDRQTTTAYTALRIASRDKNKNVISHTSDFNKMLHDGVDLASGP